MQLYPDDRRGTEAEPKEMTNVRFDVRVAFNASDSICQQLEMGYWQAMGYNRQFVV